MLKETKKNLIHAIQLTKYNRIVISQNLQDYAVFGIEQENEKLYEEWELEYTNQKSKKTVQITIDDRNCTYTEKSIEKEIESLIELIKTLNKELIKHKKGK